MVEREREKQLNVRVSKEEHERLKAAAVLAGIPVSELVRTAVNTYVQAVTGAVDPSAVLRSTRQSYASAVVSNSSNTTGAPVQGNWTVSYAATPAAPTADPFYDAIRKLAGAKKEEDKK